MSKKRPSSSYKGSPSKKTKASSIFQQVNEQEIVIQEQLHASHMTISTQEIEMERLKTTVFALNDKIKVIEDHKTDVGNHYDNHKDSEQNRRGLHDHIVETGEKVKEDNTNHTSYQNELKQQIFELNEKLEAEKRRQYQKDLDHRKEIDQHRSEITDVRNRLAQRDDEYEELRSSTANNINYNQGEINRLNTVTLSHESTILTHKQTIKHQSDVHNQHQTAQEHITELIQQKDELQEQLHQSSDYILQLEEKVYKANKTSLELLKQLKDAEVEIETLKQYIIDLKQRIAVYIPVKADSTDKKLAEFINNYPERSKLKIMFMRESEGVYQFGTKRVAVKVEKDNIKIRVGGGFLSIDEFLDQYTPVELEKLERKDPLKRFSEKVAIQKTIVNAGVREQSPVRGSSPNRDSSPQRV